MRPLQSLLQLLQRQRVRRLPRRKVNPQLLPSQRRCLQLSFRSNGSPGVRKSRRRIRGSQGLARPASTFSFAIGLGSWYALLQELDLAVVVGFVFTDVKPL